MRLAAREPSLAVVPPSVPDRDCGEGSKPPPHGFPVADVDKRQLARCCAEAHDGHGARPSSGRLGFPLSERSDRGRASYLELLDDDGEWVVGDLSRLDPDRS